jgi:hypothetical protein
MRLQEIFAEMLHKEFVSFVNSVTCTRSDIDPELLAMWSGHTKPFQDLNASLKDGYLYRASEFTAQMAKANGGLSVEALFKDRETAHKLIQELQDDLNESNFRFEADLKKLSEANAKMQDALEDLRNDMKSLFAGTLTKEDIDRRTK